MSHPHDASLQLLLVAHHQAQANQLLGGLRAEGRPVHTATANSLDSLQRQLDEQPWDVVVCYADDSPVAPAQVMELLDARAMSIPCLILSDKPDDLPGHQFLMMGACDLLASTDVPWIIRRIVRETELQRQLRKKGSLEVSHRDLLQRHQLLLDSTSDAIAYLHEGLHLYCNPAYARFFGRQDQEDMLTTSLLDLVDPANATELRQALGRKPPQAGSLIVGLVPEGRQIELVLTPVIHEGSDALQVLARPAPGNADYARELQTLRGRDLLTNFLDEASFLEQVESAIARALRDGEFSSLLLLGIQQQEEVEKSLGKSRFNQLMTIVAAFLAESLPPQHAACRLGNREFAVLLPGLAYQEAAELAQDLSSRLRIHLAQEVPELPFGGDMGLASINHHALDARDCLDRARLHQHNSARRDGLASQDGQTTGFHVHQSASTIAVSGDLLAYVEQALAQSRFHLLFQPVVNLNQSAPHCYEVLCRMLDSEGNQVSPQVFLPAVQAAGLGERLDRLVLDKALQALANARQGGFHLISNLTPGSLLSPTLLPWLSQQLRHHNVAAERLVCQLDVLGLITYAEQAKAFMSQLDTLGLALSANHFGSTDDLALFDAVKPSLVKLARDVIKDIHYNAEQRALVQDIVDHLHDHGARVVAPMVENLDSLPVIWELGIDYVQGYSLRGPSESLDYEFLQEQEITIDHLHSR